jgi:hypothetical protein
VRRKFVQAESFLAIGRQAASAKLVRPSHEGLPESIPLIGGELVQPHRLCKVRLQTAKTTLLHEAEIDLALSIRLAVGQCKEPTRFVVILGQTMRAIQIPLAKARLRFCITILRLAPNLSCISMKAKRGRSHDFRRLRRFSGNPVDLVEKPVRIAAARGTVPAFEIQRLVPAKLQRRRAPLYPDGDELVVFLGKIGLVAHPLALDLTGTPQDNNRPGRFQLPLDLLRELPAGMQRVVKPYRATVHLENAGEMARGASALGFVGNKHVSHDICIAG